MLTAKTERGMWMVVHFLITGYLFVQSLIGIDPVPYRLPLAGRRRRSMSR